MFLRKFTPLVAAGILVSAGSLATADRPYLQDLRAQAAADHAKATSSPPSVPTVPSKTNESTPPIGTAPDSDTGALPDDLPTAAPVQSFVIEELRGAKRTVMVHSGDVVTIIEPRIGIEIQRRQTMPNLSEKITRRRYPHRDAATAADPVTMEAYQWVCVEGVAKYGPAGFGKLSTPKQPDADATRTMAQRSFESASLLEQPLAGRPSGIPDMAGPDVLKIPNPLKNVGRVFSPSSSEAMMDRMNKSMFGGISKMEAQRKEFEAEAKAKQAKSDRLMNQIRESVRGR
ncbi:hypothetical protein K227x_37130 [Rubripirellula lacrimiformis]|uniref:SLA1 homology domain-containing protein n=1 Tax=Rubripirellula lacrimiformis TaxID=1930273 RepID=A0A517NDV4_9BACT|nr:hypothetical protein [Rubripirellula lacrimiformis]QDT05313.1 hypothetical protein K227x_37130 [Rubripirellula lacrimiformis]